MKTRFKAILLLLMLPAIAVAHEIEIGKYTKEKKINKTYLVNPDAGISINNSYGNVYVTTWNENKIELDIAIKVSGDSEDWVNKRLEGIDIQLEPLKHLVTAITKIGKESGAKYGSNKSIEINYTIKIPKNGGVNVDNTYGDIIAGDLFADTQIKCRYGKIALGKLSGNSNKINIGYCNKSTIDYIKTATLEADYSSLVVNDFDMITLNSEYTDIHFLSGSTIKYDSSYGKLKFGKIDNLDGSGNYLTIAVERLSGNLKIDTKYSKIAVAEVDAKGGNISVTSNNTSVGIGYNPSYSFDFDLKTKYGSVKYGKDLEISSKQEQGNVKNYAGYHKKSGVNKVAIVSDYGNISLISN